MRKIKIPLQDFALKKMQGGLMREGGAYLRDTTVHSPPTALALHESLRLHTVGTLSSPTGC